MSSSLGDSRVEGSEVLDNNRRFDGENRKRGGSGGEGDRDLALVSGLDGLSLQQGVEGGGFDIPGGLLRSGGGVAIGAGGAATGHGFLGGSDGVGGSALVTGLDDTMLQRDVEGGGFSVPGGSVAAARGAGLAKDFPFGTSVAAPRGMLGCLGGGNGGPVAGLGVFDNRVVARKVEDWEPDGVDGGGWCDIMVDGGDGFGHQQSV